MFQADDSPWDELVRYSDHGNTIMFTSGVEEIITLSRQAMEAENNHPELLVPFYSFALVLFFFYCYPIARATMYLERRYSVKIQRMLSYD